MTEVTIVAGRVADSDGVYPGSVKQTCKTCGEEVWVSPASQAQQEQAKTDVLCVQCALQLPGDTLVGVLPATITEVKAWMRRN